MQPRPSIRQLGYDLTTYSNMAQLPITAKVETRSVSVSGTYIPGRAVFFPRLRAPGQSGRNYIMGCRSCDHNVGCRNVNRLNDNKACTNLQEDRVSWIRPAGNIRSTMPRALVSGE
jgi:hypothetical protein